jgi:hypothetical protein
VSPKSPTTELVYSFEGRWFVGIRKLGVDGWVTYPVAYRTADEAQRAARLHQIHESATATEG